jgi:hypothetical protein
MAVLGGVALLVLLGVGGFFTLRSLGGSGSPATGAPAIEVTAIQATKETAGVEREQTATAIHVTPTPATLQPVPGSLTLDNFKALEQQYGVRGPQNGETFDRGNTTKKIWLSGQGRVDLGGATAQLVDNTLQITAKANQAGVHSIADTEVGRLGTSAIIQLDLAFRTQDTRAGLAGGIAFDIQDDNQSRVLFVVYSDQNWQLLTYHNGNFDPTQSTGRIPSTAIGVGVGVTSIWLVRQPDQTQIWIGANQIATLPASPFDGGRVGVAIYASGELGQDATMIFDNFKVRAP